MRIRRQVSETPLTKSQIEQAEQVQKSFLAKKVNNQAPDQTNVPIDLNPNWKMQGNAVFDEARKQSQVNAFGTQMQEAARVNDLQSIIDQQQALKAQQEAEEDAIIPPSIEEMGGEIPKDLDAYISFVEQQTVLNGVELQAVGDTVVTNPVATVQAEPIRGATKDLLEEKLYKMTLRALKDEYKKIGGQKSVSQIMNKTKMVELILAHKGFNNGTQSEEAKE